MTKEEDIITEIYGNEIKINDKNLNDKIILAPKNNDVINIINEILNRMEGDTIEYLSIDTAKDDNEENLDVILPTEFFNSLTPNGLPPHKLKLKVDAIVIVLRNLNVNEGLCNGTRLPVKKLLKYSIEGVTSSMSTKNTLKILLVRSCTPDRH